MGILVVSCRGHRPWSCHGNCRVCVCIVIARITVPVTVLISVIVSIPVLVIVTSH